GTGADEAHLALEHRPDLRKLVDPQLADDPPYSRHAGIVPLRPLRAARFGVDAHRPQLEQRERLAVKADSLLAEERRAPAVELNEKREQRDDRKAQRQQEAARGDVEQSLGDAGK